MRDVISIRGLGTECVVGVYPRERGRPQPLILDIDLGLDTEPAARTGRLSHTVDYDATQRAVIFLLHTARFGLLETAAHALATYLLAPPAPTQREARVLWVKIQLIKPEALRGNAVAALTIERDASFAVVERRATAYGSVDVVFDSREATIVRMNFSPGAEVELGLGEAFDAELAEGSGLVVDGRPFPRGTHRTPGRGVPRRWSNPTLGVQSVLCVNSPGGRPASVRPSASDERDSRPAGEHER